MKIIFEPGISQKEILFLKLESYSQPSTARCPKNLSLFQNPQLLL